MNAQATSPELETTARKAADAAFYRGVLHDLIEMGADMAGLLHAKARDAAKTDAAEGAAEGVAEGVDVTVPFERVARTVRRCIALARMLDEPVKTGPSRPNAAARGQIRHAVEDAIRSDAEASERPELREALRDRMDAPEFDDAIGSRPVEEIIAELCRELGVAAADTGMPGGAAEACAQAVRDRRRLQALRAVPLAKMSDADLALVIAYTNWSSVETPGPGLGHGLGHGRGRDDDASGGHP